ncbi:MAG: hypothetical protein M1142_05190 [Patescibacteria group bacterium]|nr:hypothetical protein [Patescibacteria group bacterium]
MINFSGYLKDQSGQILILTFAALGIALFTVLFVIAGSQVYFQNAQYSYRSESAMAIAEAGVDKALASLNKTGGSYNGEAETSFGEGSYSVIVTDKDAATKILQVTGYIPNKANPKVKRTITIQASKGEGLSFNYGMQIGNGGLQMGNTNTIKGSIYSNGNILGGDGNTFTGDVYIAGASQPTADQQSDCIDANCQDYIFGKNVGGENRQDVAQSFRPFVDGILNKVSLKLKKVGTPANPTVRIMADSSGKPNKNTILATGTLSANLVTNQYSFVDVTFSTSPNLNNGTPYWIMIHSQSLDNSNYWVWSLDLAGSYTQGAAKWSASWQAGSPVWTGISGDLGFQTYMGGAPTSLNLTNGSAVNGSVHANTVTGNMTISKDAYYQTLGPSVTVSGTKYPGSTDPAPAVFPISDANITDWKNQAAAAGITNGNVSGCPSTLGPGEINGNVSLGNSCNIKVFSPVWITGALNVGNSTRFMLDSSFGAGSGMIIVDGKTILGNSVDFAGSGTSGSYLMLLSTYNSVLNGGVEAIDSGNSSFSGIIYAPYGKVELANGSSFNELTAWEIDLGNVSTLTYQSGLASTFFSSGPAGSFSLVKGTYQVR